MITSPIDSLFAWVEIGEMISVFSNVKYYRDYENQNFLTGIEVHEDLGERSSDKYQYTLPYYSFSKNLDSEVMENNLHGYVVFSSKGNNTLSKTNIA